MTDMELPGEPVPDLDTGKDPETQPAATDDVRIPGYSQPVDDGAGESAAGVEPTDA